MSVVKAAPQVRRSLTDVIFVVAEYYGVSPSEILAKGREKSIAEARSVAMALCRDVTPCSLPEIGDVFGRDHTTVIYNVEQLASTMKKNEHLARSVAVCRARAIATIQARRMV